MGHLPESAPFRIDSDRQLTPEALALAQLKSQVMTLSGALYSAGLLPGNITVEIQGNVKTRYRTGGTTFFEETDSAKHPSVKSIHGDAPWKQYGNDLRDNLLQAATAHAQLSLGKPEQEVLQRAIDTVKK